MRAAILKYSGCDAPAQQVLLGAPLGSPLDIEEVTTRFEGVYLGDVSADDLPMIGWSTGYESEGFDEQGSPQFKMTEHIDVQLPPDVVFKLQRHGFIASSDLRVKRTGTAIRRTDAGST